ncbi:hypothetical protein PISMIDRAFT_186402 [Pisolithus microcarpus 441]|uniref:Secreted protein n=1 Tax=Pisolithus microcarpus 441 TaxID=765257 RepID=A0A0C9YR09_9AGAM|nr:hypothetical protein BKA83DRAFT_186402 [Pisolithus microcarpus]KIK27475.1 hypothetical protein PISMIDRAFT_186402 [Pisolithus microcarpus 441]
MPRGKTICVSSNLLACIVNASMSSSSQHTCSYSPLNSQMKVRRCTFSSLQLKLWVMLHNCLRRRIVPFLPQFAHHYLGYCKTDRDQNQLRSHRHLSQRLVASLLKSSLPSSP